VVQTIKGQSLLAKSSFQIGKEGKVSQVRALTFAKFSRDTRNFGEEHKKCCGVGWTMISGKKQAGNGSWILLSARPRKKIHPGESGKPLVVWGHRKTGYKSLESSLREKTTRVCAEKSSFKPSSMCVSVSWGHLG